MSHLEEEAAPHLDTIAFQVALESDKVSPESSFLQAKNTNVRKPDEKQI